jgi:hypothetical protein
VYVCVLMCVSVCVVESRSRWVFKPPSAHSHTFGILMLWARNRTAARVLSFARGAWACCVVSTRVSVAHHPPPRPVPFCVSGIVQGFYGWFQQDDSVPGDGGFCRGPNPYNNACSCPSGTSK